MVRIQNLNFKIEKKLKRLQAEMSIGIDSLKQFRNSLPRYFLKNAAETTDHPIILLFFQIPKKLN